MVDRWQANTLPTEAARVSGANAEGRLSKALRQACESLEAAAASAREDAASRGHAAGAEELLDWTEEIEAEHINSLEPTQPA